MFLRTKADRQNKPQNLGSLPIDMLISGLQMLSIFTFWGELYIQIRYRRKLRAVQSIYCEKLAIAYGTCDFDDVNYFTRRSSLLKYIQEKQFKEM